MRCQVCDAPTVPYSVHNSFSIFKCQQCGFGQADVAASDIEDLYEGSYFTTYYGNNESAFGQSKQAELSDAGSMDASKKWWIDTFVPGNNIRVLEIGPGASSAVQRYLAASRTNVMYEAVEFSKIACSALNKLGVTTHCGTIYDADVVSRVSGRFDFVIGTEVIEHDIHPQNFVSGLAQALRPGGRVCLTTGNFDGLTARITRGHWYYLHPPVHVCFFTPRSVSILFAKLGLRNVKTDCLGLNYYKMYKKLPIPGFLWLVRKLQIPTGMTITAEN